MNEFTACLHPIKGRSETVSRLALPHHTGTQVYFHEGDIPTGINKSNEVANIFAMGVTFIHNPKEGSDSAYYFRL